MDRFSIHRSDHFLSAKASAVEMLRLTTDKYPMAPTFRLTRRLDYGLVDNFPVD